MKRTVFSPHVIATIVLLASALALSAVTTRRAGGFLAEPLSTIPTDLAGFSGVENPPLNDRVLAQLTPTSYISRTYKKGALAANLFIAFYAQQRAGESMHSPKHCLPGAGWEIWDYGSAEIPVAGAKCKVNRYQISNSGERMLVLYWYQSRDRIIANEYVGKVLLARDALLQNSTAASIVRIVVPDRPGALESATELASQLIPEVQRCFGK